MACEDNVKARTAYEVIRVIDEMEDTLGKGEWDYGKAIREFRKTAKAVALCMGYKNPDMPTGIISACTRGIGFTGENAFISLLQSPKSRVELKNKCSRRLDEGCTINRNGSGFKKFINYIKERFENALEKGKVAIGILLTEESISSLCEYQCMIIGNCNLAMLQEKLSNAIKDNLDYLVDVGKYKKDNTPGIYIRKKVRAYVSC